jgi:uncharacterized membrane protein YgcG
MLLMACVSLFVLGAHASRVEAATIVTYSDRISDSAPATSSNHTIDFRTTVALDPGDLIRFTPEAGYFEVPPISEDFDHENVELRVSINNGPYNARLATTTPSMSEDGIDITSGSNGNITVTLNGGSGIPANARIRLLIGNHTENGTSTDLGIINPSATGTYAYDIATGDLQPPSFVRGRLAIVEPVSVPNVDTTELNPPLRFNGAPMGELSGTTQMVEISLNTDEFARCRFSFTPDTPYLSMGNQFTVNYSTIHTRVMSVATSTSYAIHVRCIDDEDNVNIDDYIISFTVLPPPTGTPNDQGDDQNGEGSGSGTGSGSSGSGSGSGGGNSGGSSGGGGGSGGGSGDDGDDGGAGLTSPTQPYQSGDGEVTIRGYAFPQSSVVVLVDGKVAKNARAGSDGSFSVTLEAIARGAYAFGVYAIDRDNVRSSTFSTTFTVTGSRASTLSNINVMPSVSVSPNPVNPGSPLTIKGYSIPNAAITIENQNDRTSAGLKTFTTTSASNGAWSIEMATDGLNTGTYKVRARARQEALGISTGFSAYTFYGVGQQAQVPRGSDLNRDGKVNLIDFSILLFWWNTNGGNSNPPADINGDGRVTLTDFSIMIFNWTG